jgi:hypothetical protein
VAFLKVGHGPGGGQWFSAFKFPDDVIFSSSKTNGKTAGEKDTSTLVSASLALRLTSSLREEYTRGLCMK